jgi:hypothetical protein
MKVLRRQRLLVLNLLHATLATTSERKLWNGAYYTNPFDYSISVPHEKTIYFAYFTYRDLRMYSNYHRPYIFAYKCMQLNFFRIYSAYKFVIMANKKPTEMLKL